MLRGVKTLAARMEIHDRSGRMVADFLSKHKKVKAVFYPGLPDHPQHALAKRQMSGFGSMITFETGSLKNANKMLKKVRVCSLGESLGGVETLISHPATMTHAALGEKGRKAIGITDGLVRISVGIEDVDDILEDLNAALNANLIVAPASRRLSRGRLALARDAKKLVKYITSFSWNDEKYAWVILQDPPSANGTPPFTIASRLPRSNGEKKSSPA